VGREWQSGWHLWLLAALCLIALVPGIARAQGTARAGMPGSGATLAYTQHPCAGAYDAASTTGTLLTQLIGGTDLAVLGTQTGTDGAQWDEVRLWGSLTAYVRASDVAAQPPAHSLEGICAYPGLPDALSNVVAPESGPWTFGPNAHLSGHLIAPTTLLDAVGAGGFPVAEADQGTAVTISQWAADSGDLPWYFVAEGSASGWAPASAVRLDMPDPATYQVNGAPVWQSVAGKGLWFTNYLPHHSDVGALVQAAKQAGLTYIYAEVAISQFGFYAGNTLDRLLPVAHAAGIKVIGWVYPDLHHVASDVRLTMEVAQHQTPAGDHVDGIATDIEETTDAQAVYTYGQLVRAQVGPGMPMIAAVLHPWTHPQYPYEVIASTWNVIAPMDYWHAAPRRAYSDAATTTFVATSLATVRAAVGPRMAIQELGQMYNMFTDDGAAGGDAPAPSEIAADMRAARELGCIGVSYFEWQTATQAQWQVLSSTPW
jgi:hypothetical protein